MSSNGSSIHGHNTHKTTNGVVVVEARTCSSYDIPIETNGTTTVVEAARGCAAYNIPIPKNGTTAAATAAAVAVSMEAARNCSAYDIPIETNGTIAVADPIQGARGCAAYNIPIPKKGTTAAAAAAVSMEARSCAAYDIPIETNGTTVADPIVAAARTCADYAIPMENKNLDQPRRNQRNTMEDDNDGSCSSSVLDKDTIASRGITSEITRDQVHDEIQAFMDLPLAWHHEWRMFLTIVMFLTYIPVPVSVDLHPGFLMKGMVYFPLVGGLVVGGMVALVYDVTQLTLQCPPIIAAAFSTAFGWYLTGCLHEDGLGDSADGE
jgi:fructose-specific phosphotransferase system component IIB